MRHWCLCTSPENWNVCKTHSIFGFDWRYLPTLERYVRPGDRAVVYVHGGLFQATVELNGPWEEDHKPLGWTKGGRPYVYPLRIPPRIIQEGAARIEWSIDHNEKRVLSRRTGLLDDIEFIADKGKTWNQYLQVSIVRVPEEDYETVRKALAETNQQSRLF